MSASLRFTGLEEFKAALHELPIKLRDNGAALVRASAQRMYGDVMAQYPEGETGNLRKGVRVLAIAGRSAFGTAYVVRSGAPHASMFENGTKQRWTKKSKPRAFRGFMPAADIFVPTAIRVRATLEASLIRLLENQAGLQVRR